MTAQANNRDATPSKNRVGRFFLDWLKCLGLYVLVVAVGTLLFLIGSSIVGYLAYSDRPGPGWRRGGFSWTEVKFFAGWLPLLIYFLLYVGAALSVRPPSWVVSFAPRWVLRVFGGIFAGVAGLVGVLAAGWYIAISQYPVYAGVCGMIHGSFSTSELLSIAPGHAKKLAQYARTATINHRMKSRRLSLIPLMPKQSKKPPGELVFVRVVAGPQELAADGKTGGLTVDEPNQLKSPRG